MEAASLSFPGLRVRLGLEVSYRPGREGELRQLGERLGLDYVLGSVHEIGSWMFDHPAFKEGYASWETGALYRSYFGLVERLARSGVCDAIAHFDLIKVFGYRPEGSVLPFAEPALRAVKEAGLVLEVNTAGLRKPCAEIYPARPILARCFELGIPITLGSDAHTPAEVGSDLARAREFALSVGYRKVGTFFRRRCFFVAL